MKKTKISVEIHKSGSENDVFTRMVANINEGTASVSPNDLFGYLNTRNAVYPTLHSFSFMHEHPTLHISEDGGKTFTISLTWKEVNELADDLKDIPAFTNNINDIT